MVTAYYIMKLSKSRKSSDFCNNFSNLKTKVTNFSCRVCLSNACVSLNDEDNTEVLETLHLLCNIKNLKNDNSSILYLCSTCQQFIKDVILFKQKAKKTEEILKQHKEETQIYDNRDDNYIDYDEQDHNYTVPPDISNTLTIETHKNKIKTIAKMQCKVCNKVINKSYYKEHMTMHDPNHFKYICDVCGKSFRLRCAYHNHSLRHRTDFPYKCQFCPYKGQYAELLRNHMKVHIGDYRYMCTVCPARFLFKSNLNRHMFRHKEPQHTCETCKKAFHTKLTLQRHYEADHLGVKNHVCSLCGKAFGYRNAMMKHQRHVHKREKHMYSRMPTYLQEENKI